MALIQCCVLSTTCSAWSPVPRNCCLGMLHHSRTGHYKCYRHTTHFTNIHFNVLALAVQVHHKSTTPTNTKINSDTHTHTHIHLTAFFPGLPRWAGTKKVKPIWILLEQEIVSGSGISRTICKSAPRSRQITMPAPHHSVFYRPDALPAAQTTASKHWRPKEGNSKHWRKNDKQWMVFKTCCNDISMWSSKHMWRYNHILSDTRTVNYA